MPYGSSRVVRQALVHAKPWQRYLIAVAMVVGGAVLVSIGHLAGGLLAVAGVVLLYRMAQYRFGARRDARREEAGPGAT